MPIDVAFEVSQAADVRRARRAVSDLLEHVSCHEEVVHDACLAVSELVTNALLHGAPPVSFMASVRDARLRVEIADASATSGVPQAASATATSGRGLTIVDSLTQRWGVEARGAGKALWLEFPVEEVADLPTSEVHLLGVPVAAYVEAQEQLESALHEIELLALEGDQLFIELCDETVRPLRDAMEVFRHARHEGRAATEAARSAGLVTTDLLWRLPIDAADAATVWAASVADVARAVDDGLLMTPPPTMEIRRLRTWLASQVGDQLRGAPPQPFDPTTGSTRLI